MHNSFLFVLTKMHRNSGLTKAHRFFIAYLLDLFLSIQTRINFMSLSRHTTRYKELNLRLGFERQVDFCLLNQTYCQHYCRQHCQARDRSHFLLAFDLTYLPKAGKATDGVGKYWSGSAQQTLWGLEAGLLSVIDLDNQTAFHLDAIATPAKAEREAKNIDLADHYTQAILWNCPGITQLSRYIALDAYFAKKSIIERLTKNRSGKHHLGQYLHIICRLRSDAHCLYVYKGAKGKVGRPRKYAGKVDWLNPDTTDFTLLESDSDSQQKTRIYDGVVYSKFLGQKIRIALCHWLDEKGQVKSYKICFSTDLDLPAQKIVTYYQARFQQEFLIRDAKQFTGLTHCQARSVNKLEYHWNLALTAINVAKVEHWLPIPKDKRGPFSMSSIKTLYHNRLLIEKVFDNLPKSSQLLKNHPAIEQLYRFGAIAA